MRTASLTSSQIVWRRASPTLWVSDLPLSVINWSLGVIYGNLLIVVPYETCPTDFIPFYLLKEVFHVVGSSVLDIKVRFIKSSQVCTFVFIKINHKPQWVICSRLWSLLGYFFYYFVPTGDKNNSTGAGIYRSEGRNSQSLDIIKVFRWAFINFKSIYCYWSKTMEKSTACLDTFKTRLKTHFYILAFPRS